MLDAGFRVLALSGIRDIGLSGLEAVRSIFEAMVEQANTTSLPRKGDPQQREADLLPATATDAMTDAMTDAGEAAFYAAHIIEYNDYGGEYRDLCGQIYAAMMTAKASQLQVTDAMLEAAEACLAESGRFGAGANVRELCRRIYGAMTWVAFCSASY